MDEIIFTECVGFEWDIDNQTKNWERREVTKWECEQVFFNRPPLLHDDKKHSESEKRMYVLGQTDEARKLFVVFTLRNKRIRVISARDMSKKERRYYEQA